MPSSELINGVEVGPTALLPSVLQATLRRIAVSLLPDPTALPDGTLAQVVGGTWIAEPPAEAPTLLALSAPTASGMTLDWTPGDVSLHTEVWRGGVLLVTLNPGVATYNATGLDDNALYSWKVRHRTGDQFSAFSATETAWTLPLNFTGAPTLTSLTPSSGALGTSVTIAGTNLGDATAVTFNGLLAIDLPGPGLWLDPSSNGQADRGFPPAEARGDLEQIEGSEEPGELLHGEGDREGDRAPAALSPQPGGDQRQRIQEVGAPADGEGGERHGREQPREREGAQAGRRAHDH